MELEDCELQVDGNDFAVLHSAAQAGVRWRSLGGPVIGQFSTLLVSLLCIDGGANPQYSSNLVCPVLCWFAAVLSSICCPLAFAGDAVH